MPLDYRINRGNLGKMLEQVMPTKQTKTEKNAMEFLVQEPKYSFDDIILNDNQYEDIKVAIAYEKHKYLLMNVWGMRKLYPEHRGLMINLYGEPGTGKTMAAHAIAKALNTKMIVVNYAEIESKYVGETSKNLVRLFQEAEEKGTVLLFDEADALLSKRVTNMTSSNDVSVNQTKSVLLNILNDYSGIVVFTTNFISNYDYAFLRRIPFQIRFDLPNEEQRKQIWERYLSTGIPYQCDIGELARKYGNISGSDIANAIWTAALGSAERGEERVGEDRIVSAIEKIVKAKMDNKNIVATKDDERIVSVREVSEEYALSQIKGKG